MGGVKLGDCGVVLLALVLQRRGQAGRLRQRCLQQGAALLRFAFIAPASLASSTSRDSRSASLPTSAADMACPSNTPPLMTSSGLVRAKSRRPFAASTTSPWTKASAVGPVNSSSSPVMPASAAARLASVFLVTE